MMSALLASAVISLSLSAHGWPQVRSERLLGEDIREENIISDISSRGLSVIEDTLSEATLPVPQLSQRHASGNLDSTNSFQQDAKQGLPADDISPGLLTLPVLHVKRPSLSKRQVQVQIENRSDVAYYVQLNIGNPAQKVFVQLDTGSFELWVNPDCRELPVSDNQFCQAVGRYNPNQSSSSQISNMTRELQYGIGSAQITYVLDDIALANSQQMKQVQFGVARSSRDQFSGILGIGHGAGINTGYKNFIDQLADQGVIKSKAYSVALGSKTDEAGVVVMGGIDAAKFAGKLAPLPLIPGDKSPDGVTRFWVNLMSVQHSLDDGRTTSLTNVAMPVFLDTGATLTLLPPRLADDIARQLGAQGLDENGLYMVDCGLASKNGSLDFSFDGVTIQVPYREMMRETTGLSPSCFLGIMPSTSFILLGDTFLRSAYVVFDISNNMTYMAPYANCGSETRSIDASTDLASIVGTCSAQQVNTISQPGSISNDKTGAGSAGKSWSWLGVLGAVAIAALTL